MFMVLKRMIHVEIIKHTFKMIIDINFLYMVISVTKTYIAVSSIRNEIMSCSLLQYTLLYVST